MSRCQRVVPVVVLLGLATVQTGCVSFITQPNSIQVSSDEGVRNQPDLARLARCAEIEVAVANSSGEILYGEFTCPGVVRGFVLQEEEIDKASLGRIRDRVGETFAENLQRAFPDKKVLYYAKGPDFSTPGLDSREQDPDRSALCLLSYTYVIHTPTTRRRVVKPIWAKLQRTLPGAVAVIESSPPLLLPRAQAYVVGVGWARDKSFWTAGWERGAVQVSTTHTEFPLGCSADVDVIDELRSLYPKKLLLDYTALERAMLKWAEHRASDVAKQLSEELRDETHGR